MPDGQHRASEPAEQHRVSGADWQQLAGRPAGRLDERHAGFQQVDCDRCGAAVLVAKFSPQHTSVQWSQPSVRACAEFSARAAAGERTALIDTCASLRDSIDQAVSEGRLQVSPP